MNTRHTPGVLFDRRHDAGNGQAWAREWGEDSLHLFSLLEEIDREGMEPATALLEGIRQCRERLGDPPDADLRRLWHSALDSLWEAARATLYGDLALARTQADAARRHAREMEEWRAVRESE